jgi:hypothetical protein
MKIISLGFSAWQRRDIQHNDSPHEDKKWQTQQKRAKMLVRQNPGKSFSVFTKLGPYSQHSNVFVTCKWAQLVIVLYITLGWKGLPVTNARA